MAPASTKRGGSTQKKISQEVLLAEAVETERENQKWLEVQRRTALAAHGSQAYKVERSRRCASRRLSRRGCYVTVTFPEADLVPDIFKETERPEPIAPPLCAVRVFFLDAFRSRTLHVAQVTRKRARYRDPLTGLPFADSAAFSESLLSFCLKETKIVSPRTRRGAATRRLFSSGRRRRRRKKTTKRPPNEYLRRLASTSDVDRVRYERERYHTPTEAISTKRQDENIERV